MFKYFSSWTRIPAAETPAKVKDLKLCKKDDEGANGACEGVLTLKWGQTRLSTGGPTVSGDLGLLQGLTPLSPSTNSAIEFTTRFSGY